MWRAWELWAKCSVGPSLTLVFFLLSAVGAIAPVGFVGGLSLFADRMRGTARRTRRDPDVRRPRILGEPQSQLYHVLGNDPCPEGFAFLEDTGEH